MNEIDDDSRSIIFQFKDDKQLVLSKNQIMNISTSFYYKNINKINSNVIKIPDNITYKNFTEFLEIIKNNSKIYDEQASQENKIILNENIDLAELIQISEFFENETFSLIILNEIEGGNKINKKNSYLLLILSYNKLNELNNYNNYNNEYALEEAWLNLFMKSLDIVGKNLLYFYEENKLDAFDKKIIDELMEIYSKNLISNDFLIDYQENKEDNLNNTKILNKDETNNNINNNVNNEKAEGSNIHVINTINKEENEQIIQNDCKSNQINIYNEKIIKLNILKNIISYLINRRSQNDFFCLLSNEFMKISSEENINEINNLPNPTFLLKLDINDVNNYYEEFPIDNQINNDEQKKIVFIIYYKKTEDSFNISLKLTKYDKINVKNNNSNNITTNNNSLSSFDILTFLSSVSIEELDIKQINIKSISNNKSMHEILKINNFSKLLSLYSKEYLTIKIFLKACFTHSLLCNYLYYNFDELYYNKNINKIPKSLLNTIIRKKLIYNEIKMDKIVICLFNWLNDEINIGEDISEIIENIKWNNVSLPFLFEFIIKYSKNISQEQYENIFSNSLIGKSQNYSNIELFSQDIIKSLFISSKNMDYINLFCENKRLNKFNSFEMINYERNNISPNDIQQNKYSLENKNSKNSEQSNLMNNLNKNNKEKDNESIVINDYTMKQNKSTTNLNNNLKITNSKKKISTSKNKYNIMNSPKFKPKDKKKQNFDSYYNNKRNKSIDMKYMNNKINKTSNNKKKYQRLYLESNNNKKNLFNKSLFDNKLFKIINKKDNSNDKKTKNKISLITELNKLKIKVNPNYSNQVFQRNHKKTKNKLNYNGIMNKTENNFS